MSINRMLDKDVRQAVKDKILKAHINDPSTLVIDELGLDHGRNRVDIAVINGELHGYELKSDSDNLLRLPQQSMTYSSIMDKVTLVVGEKHAQEAINIIPDWWGIKIATMNHRGSVNIVTYRRNKKNKDIDPFELSKLIWKEEALALLAIKIKVDWRIRKLTRKDIYKLIVDTFSLDEIRYNTRAILKSRINWRQFGE
ncbi:MAG: sce7726 family protein [Haemophilus parainfluenzae]|nr:sce7726 family protein [Haemophilus parainfluenzae]MDU1101078.1 sce7726 family protein [Haemophilus parainfluenzae]DAJ38503.1 MAG TPA: DNA repair protein MmcB-like protein [Caudoviricetes sp.]